MKSDLELKHDVERELEYDPRVNAAEIGIEVREGIVTLTGSVPSFFEKLSAQDAAHHVSGIRKVANEIHVTLPERHVRTDANVAAAVRQALESHVYLPAGHITTYVAGGMVKLTGTVDRVAERDEAEAAIRPIPGVRGVVNEISVVAPEIEARLVQLIIEEALERRADREASRIAVRVDEGTVTLSGPVHSWAERRAVLGAARHAPGVHTVEDRLDVEPAP